MSRQYLVDPSKIDAILADSGFRALSFVGDREAPGVKEDPGDEEDSGERGSISIAAAEHGSIATAERGGLQLLDQAIRSKNGGGDVAKSTS